MERAIAASLGRWMDRPGPLYQWLAAALRDALDSDVPARSRATSE